MKVKIIFGLLLLLPLFGISQIKTNVGTEFWIAFPPNSASVNPTLQIFISSVYATSGTISSTYPGVDQNFTVTPGVVTMLLVPDGVSLLPGVEDKGIHIISADPVAVYGMNWGSATTDAYMALPVPSLGTDYRILTYKTTLANQGTAFSVVATQDNTALTVYNHQTNSTNTVNLNQGQTYHVEAGIVGQDLTGSRIESNFPVSVYGSVKTTDVPSGCLYGDHIVEQMWPVWSWGKNFATVPLAGRDNSGDIFRILAASDGTVVSINGTTVTTLNAGDYYETNLTGLNSISSSKETCLAQFAKSTSCAGGVTGDPFIMLIPPREQFLTQYTIGTPSGFTSHWVNIVAPSFALGTIFQDGVLIPNGAFTQIGTTGYYGAQRSITEGSHTFTGNFPFGVFVYGWTTVNSYGYPGGGSLSQVATVDSITISPPYATGTLNTTNVCFTAHVMDVNLNPVAGVLVNFNISGIGPLTGNGYTDIVGNAQYCYTRTGTIPGTDSIYAEVFGITSDTSTVDWSSLPCANPVAGGTIGNAQTGCAGFTPGTITSLTLPSGQTGSLAYKWQQSVVGPGTGFSDIPASNSMTWTPGPLLQTTWFRRLARADCMTDWSGAAASNVIELTVSSNLTASITIAASANSVCSGTMVSYTATPVSGGTAPAFLWSVNGISTGINSQVFSYVPENGDVISCRLTSSEPCVQVNPVYSNQVTMIVVTPQVVSVSVSAPSTTFCNGASVTFTAVPVNAGTIPVYQWKVSGINSGTNSPYFSYAPQSGDSVWCIMTTNQACVTANQATSNKIGLVSAPTPVVNFTRCFDSITTIAAKPVQLKGGIPHGGIYSGPGVNSATGTFTPASAGPGIKTITYTYTNSYQCSAGLAKTITVIPAPSFTCGSSLPDIRDGREYATVQIGSQCWMAADLNFGIPIADNVSQTDNCIAEKYLHAALSGNQPAAFYQWDEIMNYNAAPGSQGLCPPGWHIPEESEWMTLFTFYDGNSRAAKPLQDKYINGFNALTMGVLYLNSSWKFSDFATLFWSSTMADQTRAWAHGMNTITPSVSLYAGLKANGFPVRCLKN